MKRFLILLAVVLTAIVPAAVLRFSGWRPGPLVDTAVFGIAILAAGFMLSWGAETAERRISQGLVLAAVALVTVLPESTRSTCTTPTRRDGHRNRTMSTTPPPT